MLMSWKEAVGWGTLVVTILLGVLSGFYYLIQFFLFA
jgi:hypothetical protein